MLLLAHDVLADRRQLRALHRLAQQQVDLLAAVLRPEVVGALEVDRVDLLVQDEVGDVDRLDALGLDGGEVLVREDDELVLLHLVCLHDLVVRDGLVLGFTDLLVADPAAIRFVDEVEAEVGLLDRAVHPHRHVDEPE